jgi:hypothetical protein
MRPARISARASGTLVKGEPEVSELGGMTRFYSRLSGYKQQKRRLKAALLL